MLNSQIVIVAVGDRRLIANRRSFALLREDYQVIVYPATPCDELEKVAPWMQAYVVHWQPELIVNHNVVISEWDQVLLRKGCTHTLIHVEGKYIPSCNDYLTYTTVIYLNRTVTLRDASEHVMDAVNAAVGRRIRQFTQVKLETIN